MVELLPRVEDPHSISGPSYNSYARLDRSCQTGLTRQAFEWLAECITASHHRWPLTGEVGDTNAQSFFATTR